MNKLKKAKPVLAWGVKSYEGQLTEYTYSTKEKAQLYGLGYFGDKAVRVEIREVKKGKRKRRKCGCDDLNGGRSVCDICQKCVGKKLKDKKVKK